MSDPAVTGSLTTDQPSRAASATWVELETPGGPMRAYVASSTERPTGAVVVLQEAFGVNAHIQSVANRLAAHGYVAVAPELFHRTGHRVVEYSDRTTAMGLISDLGPDAVISDVGAAVAYARGIPTARGTCSLAGFCFGARAALTAATAVEGLDSVAAFYGPGVASGPHAVLDRIPSITARVMTVVGADDPTISAEEVKALDDALSGASVAFQSLVYPDVGHAFCCDARPEAYRAAPALDAWVRLLRLLSAERRTPASGASATRQAGGH